MLVRLLFALISVSLPSLSYSISQCKTEFGFLPPIQENTPSTYIYFYSGIEAQGGSSRFVFPQLSVSCYSKIEEILLFQGLPYACVQARTRYEFELWSKYRESSDEYELVYRELLIYNQDSLSAKISLQPNADLLMAPGDIIGFRNSTLNFYNMDSSGVASRNVTRTYTGSLEKHFSCSKYSHLTLGEEVYFLGNIAPYFNLTLKPMTPNFTEFSVQFYGNESTVNSILLYHRGIFRPFCDYLWHIHTADTLCQGANFSHATIATTGHTPYSESHSDLDISSFYWLDFLYCQRFQVDSSFCLRSHWECISNCSSVNQTAAASCAREEGRTRFVWREVEQPNNSTQTVLDRLSQFSDEFNDHRVPTVQVYYNRYWQDLSTDGWTHSEMAQTAEVICRSHGFTDVYLKAKFERESLSNDTYNNIILKCTGAELDTSECTIQQQKSSNSSKHQLILACSYSGGYLSLYNNKSHDPTQGEVLFASNQTSSKLSFVCTERWTAIESSVACSQMGYPTLSYYRVISTSSPSSSQYSYYKHIDAFSVFQADFSCLGYELSINECNITSHSNSSLSLCQKNVVDLKCATREQILTNQAQCYSYGEILGSSFEYKFGKPNSSECHFLFDSLSASDNVNSVLPNGQSPALYISSLNFGRTVSIFGSYIKLQSSDSRSKRSTQISDSQPCLILYFDMNGMAVAVAGITDRTTNTYSTLYHIDRYQGLKLTGNITNLAQPLNVSSLSAVCHHQGMTISSAYLICSGTELLTNATYPPILSDTSALMEIDIAYRSILNPSTTPVTTVKPSPFHPTNATNDTPTVEMKVILLIIIGIIALFSCIFLSFVCLLFIVRRHYKREILTLQVQSKAVVSSVYNVAPDQQLLNSDPNNSYVQQNVYYYKLKHQSTTRALFIESTRSMRHTIRRISIAPRFGLTMPEVDYVQANSKRNHDLEDQWSIERDQLVYLRELGLGHYGKVQLMEAKQLYGCEKLPVAVKTLSTQDPVHTEQFMREIDLMKTLWNEYIVSLLGYCSPSRDATPLMVLEYLQYGDLKSLIVTYQDTPTARENELNILHLVSMAANIASAMVYLADNHFVHRDIAARNCLVGRQLVCKLSDFGLALMTDGSDSSVLPRACTTVPLKWTAPETFLSGVFSFKSDIWSYGVFLWEIFTYGCDPLDELTKEELVTAIKDGALVMPHIQDAPSFCNDLVQMCCFFNPEQRPSICDIQSILEGVMYKIESEESSSTNSENDTQNLLVESTM